MRAIPRAFSLVLAVLFTLASSLSAGPSRTSQPAGPPIPVLDGVPAGWSSRRWTEPDGRHRILAERERGVPATPFLMSSIREDSPYGVHEATDEIVARIGRPRWRGLGRWVGSELTIVDAYARGRWRRFGILVGLRGSTLVYTILGAPAEQFETCGGQTLLENTFASVEAGRSSPEPAQPANPSAVDAPRTREARPAARERASDAPPPATTEPAREVRRLV
jgi:hypothetical protein